jgi:hypothetical protein
MLLGKRTGGTTRLKEAVAAHREALKEYTREGVPLQWAATQMNLALAYRALYDKVAEPRVILTMRSRLSPRLWTDIAKPRRLSTSRRPIASRAKSSRRGANDRDMALSRPPRSRNDIF